MRTFIKVFMIMGLLMAPSLIFLIFYYYQGAASSTLLNHLLFVLSAAAALFLISLALLRSAKYKIADGVVTAVHFIWFAVALSAYTVMVIGLFSWGRIPTLGILAVYFSQFEELTRTLDVPLWLMPLFVLCSLLFIGWLAWATVRQYTHITLSVSLKPIYYLFLPACLCTVFAGRYVLYEVVWDIHSQEPLRLMLNNGVSRSGANVLLEVLGHHADNRLILQDTQIRQNYVARQERPVKSVILITVDALRPDRMSLYGAPRVTTPYLQQMRAQGLAHPVREARSACPESTCGLLSLLSGKEPHILLANNFGLPEILGRLGYQRYFLLSGDHSNYYGLKESYGEHEVYWDGTSVQGYANDDFQLLKQLEIMPQALQDQRYFFFIHLMSVHGLGRRNERFLQWYPYQSIYHPSSSLSFGSDFAPYYNYYDNGILQADFLVHRIFNLLKTKNYIDDSSIVLLTADHGESLGEHGVKSHAESLYDSVIRIPWVWLGPRPIGHTESPVIQADFAPTVLQELGAPIPPHWSGLPLQQGSSQRLHTYHAQLPLAAVVEYGQNTKKLIFDFHSQEKLFFNLSHDPKEMYPLQDMDFGMADKLNNAGFSFFSYAQ